MFGNWFDGSRIRARRSDRRADRRRRQRADFASEISRTLRIEPLESRRLLASDFDFATASATPYTAGHIGGFVAAADFDGIDGTDLVVANDYVDALRRSSGLSVLVNNGEGIFSRQAIPLPNNNRPQAVDVKDVDGINGPDLVVASFGVHEPANIGQAAPAGSVFVLLNDGNGSFGTSVNHAAGDGPIDVVAANLDGQGRLDYVTANFRSDDISVLLEQAGGVMTSSRLDAGTSPVAVAVGTINDDAHLDLAVANLGSNDISLFHGDGQGGFTAAALLTGLDRPSDLLLGDVDGDGDTDLVAANYGSERVSVFRNDGAGGLQLHFETSVAGAESLAFGDTNHDNRDDLFVTSARTGAISILMNEGGGNFSVPNTTIIDPALCSGDPNQRNLIRSKCNPKSVVAAQLNADGDLDVAIADIANGISVHLNGQAVTISGRAFEDFNGDGDDENGGDPGLGGVVVDLYLDRNLNDRVDPGDQHVGRKTSATGTGAFSFAQVSAGRHILVGKEPAGARQTVPGANGYVIDTRTGVGLADRDFGFFEGIAISGRKFNDINGDGDDENGDDPGMGGVIIELFRDANGNGLLDPSIDTLIGTRTTATGTGAYEFANNLPGIYFVAEVVPAGWEQTAPSSLIHSIAAQFGTDVPNLDFGNHFTNITISGRKFDDVNEDGDDENGGDPGLGGITIELLRDSNGNGSLDTADTLVGTRTTATGSGAYSFADNGPGTYFVREVVPANSTQTAPPGGIFSFVAQSGINVANQDFGNSVTAPTPDTCQAVDDQLTIAQDGQVTLLPPHLLANDTLCTTGQTSIISLGIPSEGGEVSVNGVTGNLTYTTPQGFAGQETFTYMIGNENGATSSAIVVVTIVPTTFDIVAVDDMFTVDENSSGNFFGVLTNDFFDQPTPTSTLR